MLLRDHRDQNNPQLFLELFPCTKHLQCAESFLSYTPSGNLFFRADGETDRDLLQSLVVTQLPCLPLARDLPEQLIEIP